MSSPPDANMLLNTGRKYFAKKAYKEALDSWRAAQKQFNNEGKKREVGIASIEISKALMALGQQKEALVSCTQAVRILREVKALRALREALITMGQIMDSLRYHEEAIRALNQALEIDIQEEDKASHVILLTDIGRLLARAGRYQESAVRFAEAAKISEQLDDLELKGETLAEYARILQQRGYHDKAEKVLIRLIELWQGTGKIEQAAYAHLGLASTYLALEDFDKAEGSIQQAQGVFLKTKDKMGTALTEYHRARILLRRGHPEQALPHAETALQHFEKEQNLLAYAESALVVAQILEQLVQDVRALRLFDKAIEIFSQLGEQARILQTHVLKGKALLRLRKQKQAEQEFTQAIRYYQEHNRPDQEAYVYLEVGESFYQLAQFTEAVEQSKMALKLFPKFQDEKMEIAGYRLLVKAASDAQRLNEEIPFLQKVIKDAEAQGKNLLASSLSVSLAKFSIEAESPEQVKLRLEKAIHNQQLPIELRAEASLTLGQVLMKKSQYSEAAQYLSQAIKDFGTEPSFDRSSAFHQLSEAYRYLKKPSLRKEALTGALDSLEPQGNEKIRGRLLFELAPLIETEDTARALDYYEKAATIFYEWEDSQNYFQSILQQARLHVESSDFDHATELINKAIIVGEELDIPLDFSPQNLPLSWNHMQQAIEEAILIGAQQYHTQNDRTIIDKLIDWSGPRKIARLHPFLAPNLSFERCIELPKLVQEESQLLTQVSQLRQELTRSQPKGIPHEEYLSRRNELKSKLKEALEKINVNRNVIAAACQDPGRVILPYDYKMLQKLTALMPLDRRWILINYDVLMEKQRIVITTLDHIGRHNIHTMPISSDLESVIQTFQDFQTAQDLPSIADLRDMASFLYRSLVPSRLELELQNQTYGFLQFITDGFLNNVPFELVFDGKEYWGLKYPMAWSPDFQLFESTLKTKALAQAAPPSVLLGVNTNSGDGARRKEKAEEIAKSFLAAVPTRQGIMEPIVLFGRDFTRKLLSNNLDQPRALLFFSTPTTIHHRKGEISLQEPDSLRVIEIGVTTHFEGAPILVLDEAIRSEARADGLSLAGFLRHLVAAGSPSIVFTRWLPEPHLQPAFAQALVKQLYEGDPIAVAMLHTRRKMATRGPSPHSWLSYSLCGNPFPAFF